MFLGYVFKGERCYKIVIKGGINMRTNSLLKKGLTCATIVLFLGAGITSASCKSSSNPVITKTKGSFGPDHIAYAFASNDQYSGLAKFYLNDPGNVTIYGSSGSFSGADFAPDGTMYCVAYGGGLFEVDIVTGDCFLIASTIPLNGLTYDITTDTWYASGGSPDGLLTIDIDTGVTTYVGSYGISNIMIGLACDNDGNLYGYDVLFGGDSHLYSINKDTGEATAIGAMGYNFCYAQDPAYDRDDGILYIAGYFLDEYATALFTCDTQTAECTIVGYFEVDIDAFAIPYGVSQYPYADFTWTPQSPYPGDSVLFNASISYDPDGYITLYEWDWNNDGVYEESHTIPTTTHSWASPGNYTITLQVTDNTGLKGTKSKTILIGEINVTITGTMGNNGWYVSNVVITINCGMNLTYYKLHAEDPWTEYTGSPICISTDGVYELWIACVDSEGHWHIFDPYPFKIDKTAPTISLTVMSLNCLKTKWLLNATATDATSGVALVEFYIDDELVANITAPGPYTFTYKGKGKIAQAIVYDNAGNPGMSSMQINEYIPAMNNLQILILYVFQLFQQMMEQRCQLKR